MTAKCISLVSCVTVVAHRWVESVVYVAEIYTTLFDPRPDLAIPARSTKLPYAWWW